MNRIITIVTFIVAACSIVYELAIANSLAELAANTVVWYALVVGFFLLAMGLGSLVLRFVPKRFQQANSLVAVEILLSIAGACSIAGVHVGHMLFEYISSYGFTPSAVGCFLVISLALTMSIGFLTGMELPLVMEIAKDSGDKDSSAYLLGVDYLGSLVGGVIFPLLLVPNFSPIAISVGTACVNIVVALFLICWLPIGRKLVNAAAALVVLVLNCLALNSSEAIDHYFVVKYYSASAAMTFNELFTPNSGTLQVVSRRSPYQRIDLVHDPEAAQGHDLVEAFSSKFKEQPDFPRSYVLYLNGDFQTNTTTEEVYHEFFAHVPVIAYGRVPKRVLVLGGGDGFVTRELLKYPGIERIEHLDLDRTLIELAQKNPVLTRANQSSFLSPRVHNVFGDGFYYIRNTSDRYDAIYIDFPVPVDYNLSRLYSKEFFFYIRQALTPGGYAVFDSTGTGLLSTPQDGTGQEILPGNDWPYYYSTLKSAGFAQVLPFVTTLGFGSERAAEQVPGQTVPADPLLYSARTLAEQSVVAQLSVRQALDSYVLGLQQGFIIMSNQKKALEAKWWDPGVPLYVLNEKRFYASFQPSFPKEDYNRPQLVNSILRPTFPNSPAWYPRTP